MLYYVSYFNELIKSDFIFWFCALTGSGMFLVQFIINIFGISDHDSFDTNDNSADALKFKWLSIQAITGFLMMFGWTALTCQKEFGLNSTATIGISICVGLLAVVIMRFIFRIAKKLKSSGSIYKIEDAIGKEAYVYQRIPKDGMGKISLTVQHFTHEINAISYHSEELPSFSRVKIIKKSDDHTVIVSPL